MCKTALKVNCCDCIIPTCFVLNLSFDRASFRIKAARCVFNSALGQNKVCKKICVGYCQALSINIIRHTFAQKDYFKIYKILLVVSLLNVCIFIVHVSHILYNYT